MAVPRLDHVVVDVGHEMDAGEARYRALGFQLTARAHHSLGSSNHLAIFATDYLELLSPGTGARPDLAGFPNGLNGLVFDMADADSLHATQAARGVPVQSVQEFTRGVDLPDGSQATARFKTVRLPPRALFDGRVYFCQHFTPELVWRPEWRVHPNGAVAIARVALAAAEPDALAAHFERMFGPGAVPPGSPRVLMAGSVAVEIWPAAALAALMGADAADADGRGDHMALLGIRVASLDATMTCLHGNGVTDARREANRIIVPPARTMNVAMEFTA